MAGGFTLIKDKSPALAKQQPNWCGGIRGQIGHLPMVICLMGGGHF